MKLEARQLARFLADPGPCRLVLLHGEDSGLVRARAETLIRAVAGRPDDPFLVTTLDRPEHSRLAEEASALSLVGGRRVVRVRDAGEALAPVLSAALDRPGEALIVVEAEALPPRSKLRALAEQRVEAAAIACYPEEGRGLEASLREMLRARAVEVEPEALAWLAENLGADQSATRGEAEKLALYVGAGGTVSLADAQACVGDAASLSLDDALYAATAGDAARADRALARALEEGAASVSIIRAAAAHLARLAQLRAAAPGEGDAVRLARPPIFARRQPAMRTALAVWTPAMLDRARQQAWAAEILCKQTGARDAAICGWLVLGMALMARAARGR